MLSLILCTATLGQSIFVDRGDYSIHCQTIGSGKPMVAIAGGPGFDGRAVWGIGFGMRRTYKTYLFDQLGTGKSQMKKAGAELKKSIDLFRTVEDLEALRQKEGHKKWTVFGQSWGVIVGLVYAAKYPERVERLILTSVPGLGFEGNVLGANLGRVVPDEVQKSILSDMNDPSLTEEMRTARAVFAVLPYYFYEPSIGMKIGEKASPDMFSPTVFHALEKHIKNASAYLKHLESLRRTKFPVTILQGNHDPCGAQMPFLLKEKYLPQAKISMIIYAGHFPWLETSDLFFGTLHSALGLPLPEYLNQDAFSEHSSIAAEDKARTEMGWPFGIVDRN